MLRMHQILLRVYLAANLLPEQAHPFRGVITLPESRFVASRYLCVFDIEQSRADLPLGIGA